MSWDWVQVAFGAGVGLAGPGLTQGLTWWKSSADRSANERREDEIRWVLPSRDLYAQWIAAEHAVNGAYLNYKLAVLDEQLGSGRAGHAIEVRVAEQFAVHWKALSEVTGLLHG